MEEGVPKGNEQRRAYLEIGKNAQRAAIVEHGDCGRGVGGRVEARNRVLSLGEVTGHK